MERIEWARKHGDPLMGLEPQCGRADGQGGAMPGRKQAVLGADGDMVARFSLRIPAPTLDTLRQRAESLGITLNAYLVSILIRAASETPPPTDDTPPPF